MKKYSIVSTIHEGHKSTVYRVKNNKGESFIIKTLNNNNINKKYYKDIEKEFQILKMVNHNNVIKAIELLIEDKKTYLVEEDIAGLPVSELLNEEESFSLKEFLDIAIAIVNGINAIHSNGIIHKDIKPHNIIYNRNKNLIKIIDFDNATIFSRETPEYSTNILEGTLHYVSPEQTGRTGRKIDYRTDYYSLGVLFFQMITGMLPFDGESAIELIHQHIAAHPNKNYFYDKKIPETVSEIILKLLSKLPENRYQTIDGLAFDLEKAKILLLENKPIHFPIGLNDFSTKLLFPEKLYGREFESKKIIDIFEAYLEKKANVFNVLIRGETGMGKLSLAHELYPLLLEKNGYSIYIKFNINISKNLQSIFQNILNQYLLEIFKENQKYIEIWKTKQRGFIERNIQLILKLFPESQKLFQDIDSSKNYEFDDRNMIDLFSVINDLNKPILLVLEDSQWLADDFSIILENWIELEKNTNLFIVYTAQYIKESESHFQSNLVRKMKEKYILEEIYLGPLSINIIKLMIGDLLSCSPNESHSLSEVLYQKTNGNPFFLFEFLHSLYHKSLLHPPSKKNSPWTWNLELIQMESVTENVANILYDKIQKMDLKVYEILKFSSCHGDEIPLIVLSNIFDQTELEIATMLNPVVSENMISINQNNIRFAHSKFRSLIYNNLELNEKVLMHKKIAKAIKKLTLYFNDDFLIDFAYHQNIAKDLLNVEDKIDLLKKNVTIAQQYTEVMNFDKAEEYYSNSIDLIRIIPKDKLSLEVKNLKEIFEETIKTEIEILNFQQAEKYLELAKGYLIKIEYSEFLIFRVLVLIGKSEFKDATFFALDILEGYGITVKSDPKKSDEFSELFKIKNSEVDFQNYSEQFSLADQNTIRKHEILFLAITSAWTWNIILFNSLALKLVQSSITEGYSYLTPFALLVYAMILNSSLEDQEMSDKVSDYSEQLINYFNNKGSGLAFSFTYYSFIQPWNLHFKDYLDNLSLSKNKSNQWLQFRYSSLILLSHALFLFLSRENISSIQFFINKNEEIILKNNQKDCEQVLETLKTFLKIIGTNNLNIVLNSEIFQSFIDSDQNLFQENIHFKLIVVVLKIIACYLNEHYLESYKLARLCDDYLKSASSHVFLAEFLFFDSLTCLSLFKNANEEYKDIYKNHILKNREKLKKFSLVCEENFANKFYLVEAEMAKIANDRLSAIDYYTKAIEFAKRNEFLLEEAIANELLGKFWFENGQTKYEELHIVQAVQIYAIHGSNLKVEILKQKYPKYYMKNIERNTRYLSSRTSSHFQLDVLNPRNIDIHSIIKSAYSISSDMGFHDLLDKINKIIVENSGAERGVILLKDERTQLFYIENDYSVNSVLKNNIKTLYDNYTNISKTILGLCERTGQIIVTKEANKDKRFQSEPYIAENLIKSILCIPMVSNGSLEGLIYLENNQIIDAFPIDIIENIDYLISQITISIENAKYYISLKEESNRYKKLIPWESMNFLVERANTDIEVENYLIKELTICILGIESFENLQQELSSGQMLSILNLVFGKLSEEVKNKGYIDKIIRDRIVLIFDNTLEEVYKIIDNLKFENTDSLLKYHLTSAISRSSCTIGVIGLHNQYRTTLFSRSEDIALALEDISRKYKTSTLILEDELKNINYDEFSYRSIGPLLFHSRVLWVVEISGYKKKEDVEKYSLFAKAIRKLWGGNLTEAELLFNEYVDKYDIDSVINSFLLKIEYHKSNQTKPKFLNL